MRVRYTIDDIITFRKDLKRHFKMSVLFWLLSLTTLTAGALLFYYIEHCYDVRVRPWNEIEKSYFTICKLIQKNKENGTAPLCNFPVQNWNNTMLSLCSHSDKELEVAKCKLDSTAFYKWLIFTTTVGYTIGFGSIVPFSDIGKITTIIYAVPAIGITMTFNMFVGKFLVDFTKILIVLLETKVSQKKVVSRLHVKVFLNQVLIAVLFCFVYAIECQRLVIMNSDRNMNLSYTDAIYFSFVTMSTIGFGDIAWDIAIVEDKKSYAYTLLIFWIGMAVMASVLASLSDFFATRGGR